MKILNSIQELWTQCSYCPLCKDICRSIAFYSDLENISILSYNKINNYIKLTCQIENNKQISTINYNINCLDNSIEFDFQNIYLKEIPAISCQMIGSCHKCFNTFSISTSFILDFNNKNVCNIGIDKDNILLIDSDNKYNITLLYYSNTMLISKWKIDENFKTRVMEFPIIKLDFSNPKIVINKIKILLLFS